MHLLYLRNVCIYSEFVIAQACVSVPSTKSGSAPTNVATRETIISSSEMSVSWMSHGLAAHEKWMKK
jgi:hypothetical protein